MNSELSTYVQEFEASEEATMDARKLAERDRDYRDHKQWTAEEEATLKKRKQPVITYNRIQRKVNAMLGLEKQSRKDPRAYPRTPGDDGAASAATDALRYVCENNRWDDKRSAAADNLLCEGTAVIMVGARQVAKGIDPDIQRIAWDRYYHDPHSSEFDFSDKQYDGIVIWMDMTAARSKWPDRADALESTCAMAADSDTYDDKPKYRHWADAKRRRVRVCEHYCLRDGVWIRSVFTKGGFLEDPQPSPYQDEDKRPANPLHAVSLYVDRENNRFGEVRGLIGPQDEINKRRSKALHLMTMRQVRVSRSSGMAAEDIRRELAKPDGVVFGERDEFEILATNDMAQANLAMLAEAKAEIDLMSINAALSGKNEQAMSGRAILAQQQGGMIEAANFLDRIRVLSLMVYRASWDRVRQYWDAERWVRVTDDEQNLKFVGLNTPVRAVDQMAEQMGVTPENFEQFAQERPEEAARLQMFARSPQGQQTVEVKNAVAEMDVDIIVDEGFDTPTVAAEQFEQLMKLEQARPGTVPIDVMIESSSLRNKSRLLEMLKTQQAVDPMAEQMKQIQMDGAAAQVEKTRSETLKNFATADNISTETDIAENTPLYAGAM